MLRPSPDAARQRVVEMIGDSVFQTLALKESLHDERLALESQDMEALRLAIDNKGRCVAALQALEQQRRDYCVMAGFEDDPGQMDNLAEWCDEDSALQDCWQHLLDLAVECNAENLTNGAIIRSRKQQIEAGLAIIRGGGTDAVTYGRSGQAPSGPSQRPLAEA